MSFGLNAQIKINYNLQQLSPQKAQTRKPKGKDARNEKTNLKRVGFANIKPYFSAGKVSFAATVKLPGTDRAVDLLSKEPLPDDTKAQLRLESAKRVNGDFSWPARLKSADLNPWMVSAETSTFMKIGGLAQVAIDLPNSFNERFSDDVNQKMSIVTPLYLSSSGKKKASIKKTGSNQYEYTGAQGKSIKLDKADTIKVPVYSDKTKEIETEYVDVLKGKTDGTTYIFLQNDKFFDIDPHKDNPSAKEGPYVISKNGVDEAERFAFMSKAVYELMKKAKADPVDEIEKPNVIIANDWHVGPISGLTKYMAPAMESRSRLDSKTAEYLRETPIVYIAHNPQYQGWDYENTGKLLNALYEGAAKDIVANAVNADNSRKDTQSSLYIRGTYNAASQGITLADRVVPVSDNYAEEISKSSGFGYDFTELFAMRKKSKTLKGITNGYSKSAIVPSQNLIADINRTFGLDEGFKVYDQNDISARESNKKVFAELLEDFVKGEKHLTGVTLYKPDDSIREIKNIKNTPIITSVGRFSDQKGFDIFAQALEKSLTEVPEGKEKPIVVILGSGDEKIAGEIKSMKDKLAVTHPETAKRVLLFEGFNKPFADAIQLSGDFFAIPSKFEPCGLTQMEAMAKGNIPVATSTGGLVNTIDNGIDGFRTSVFYTQNSMGENELIYDENPKDKPKDNVKAFAQTLKAALNTFYENPEKISQMSQNAMKKDFSWGIEGGSLDKYIELFKTGKVKE